MSDGFEHTPYITAINVVAVSLSLADYFIFPSFPSRKAGPKRGQPTNHVRDVLAIMIQLRVGTKQESKSHYYWQNRSCRPLRASDRISR